MNVLKTTALLACLVVADARITSSEQRELENVERDLIERLTSSPADSDEGERDRLLKIMQEIHEQDRELQLGSGGGLRDFLGNIFGGGDGGGAGGPLGGGGLGSNALCGLIESQFQGNVACDCTVQLTGNIGYSCSTLEPTCLGPSCGTVVNSGQLNILGFSAIGETCFIPNLLGAAGAACVNVSYELSRRGTGEALSCQATLGGLACASCNPCNGGVALNCENVEPSEGEGCNFLGLVQAPGLGGGHFRDTIAPFIPGRNP